MVKFVSAKPYMNVPMEELLKLLLCLHGRKEVVVLCEDEALMQTLKYLPSDYLQPRLKDLKKYLIDNNIPFTEDFKGTTVV